MGMPHADDRNQGEQRAAMPITVKIRFGMALLADQIIGSRLLIAVSDRQRVALLHGPRHYCVQEMNDVTHFEIFDSTD
jgi:hypothetical protein